MLGEAFRHQFKAREIRCTDVDVNSYWLEYLDFRDFEAYRSDVMAFAPDVLIHLGAHTDLEFCERNVDDCYLTNAIAPENAVFIANELGIPIVYVSTAGIFDGQQDTYDDWDLPNPLGHYARSKYAGELFVSHHADRYLTCRAGWMMGGGPTKDKKFVNKLMRQLKDGKTELHIVADKLGTPTYTHDFARSVGLLLEKETWGLYNMVCEGVTSRLGVAREMLEILGLEESVSITEVSSDFFADEYFAERPYSERLINRKLQLRGLYEMRDWRVSLREYLETYYDGFLTSED
jgi:dTDP-4-dehydrorhamnose reductase